MWIRSRVKTTKWVIVINENVNRQNVNTKNNKNIITKIKNNKYFLNEMALLPFPWGGGGVFHTPRMNNDEAKRLIVIDVLHKILSSRCDS